MRFDGGLELTFNDIFGVTYATFCGVQLGESFVKRPSNIGAGQWMDFWEQLIKEYDTDEEEINPQYIKQIEDENENLCVENDDLKDVIVDLE